MLVGDFAFSGHVNQSKGKSVNEQLKMFVHSLLTWKNRICGLHYRLLSNGSIFVSTSCLKLQKQKQDSHTTPSLDFWFGLFLTNMNHYFSPTYLLSNDVTPTMLLHIQVALIG